MANTDNMEERVRRVAWDDPRLSTRDANAISGLDFLAAIKNKKIPPPPIARLMNYEITDLDKGYAVFEFEPGEFHYNAFSTVHGGVISTILDTTMTSSVITTLAIGAACSTVELKVNFIRPITLVTGRMRCEAQTIHVGNTIATAEGRLIGRDEKLYAHGLCTCAIFKT